MLAFNLKAEEMETGRSWVLLLGHSIWIGECCLAYPVSKNKSVLKRQPTLTSILCKHECVSLHIHGEMGRNCKAPRIHLWPLPAWILILKDIGTGTCTYIHTYMINKYDLAILFLDIYLLFLNIHLSFMLKVCACESQRSAEGHVPFFHHVSSGDPAQSSSWASSLTC